MSKSIELSVAPLASNGDDTFIIFASGLIPNQKYNLSATTTDESGKIWESWGLFCSDKDGRIDLTNQAPEQGTFFIADPTALLWSMRPKGEEDKPIPMFEKTSCEPLVINLTLSKNRNILSATSFKRIYLPSGIKRICVDDNGIVGTLFFPEGKGPFPLIVCLTGSGGGITEPRASLLARHGYAVFALAYFGMGTLPKTLNRVPIEFYENGVNWTIAHAPIDRNKIGVFGISKGGELALLLGTQYPEIKAVAAFSGSAYVWQGIGYGKPDSSWTKNNESLPFITMKMPLLNILKLILQKPVAFKESYIRGLKEAKNKSEAVIPVEKTNGPIFFIAGTNDQVWPAVDFGDQIADRIRKNNSPYPYEYLRENGAGHLVCLPYLPSAEMMDKLIFCSSHTAQNSLASIKAWNGMVEFFKKYL